MEGISGMTDEYLSSEELAHFRRELTAKRDEVLKRPTIVTTDVRELADNLDFATAVSQNSVDELVCAKDSLLLVEIEDALERLSNSEYGICEGSGELIPRRRLMVQPWARYIVSYQEVIDKLNKQRRSHRGVTDEDSGKL